MKLVNAVIVATLLGTGVHARAQPAPAPPPPPPPPIDFPEVLTTPTGWLLPAAVLYSKNALDTGGGVTSEIGRAHV